MKFDLIISNPPYNQNLDLKILKEIYDLGEKICFVHPVNWLYDIKEKTQLYNDLKVLLKNSLESVTEFNMQEYFNAWVFSSMGITLINKNVKNHINIYDFDVHGNSNTYKSLKVKILSYKQSLQEKISRENDSNFFECSFSSIRGHNDNADFYTFLKLTEQQSHIGIATKYPIKFLFKTELEADNFKNYLKTKLSRFCLSIYKLNQNLDRGELASVPYMPTYARPWTDEDVAKELGLTEEELAWAINWIPDYYQEDAEKYAKYKL